VYFTYIFTYFLCKSGDLQLTVFVSAHVHILVSWPDDDQSLGSKLIAV